MRKSVQLRIFAMVLFALLASAATAHAQATRTWVSGVGDDANPCSRTAPCKTFAGAISKTAPCGEIDVLDPGGFGAVTITKCISIEAEEFAGVLVSGTNAIVISAGANDDVTIRGITFEGLNTGLAAIKVLSAGSVHIESCWFQHFNGNGANTGSAIDVEPGSPTVNLNLAIKDTAIRDNQGASTFGIFVKPAAGVTVKGTIDHMQMENNAGGLRVEVGGKVAVRNSDISNNKGNGVIANGGIISLESTMISNNGSNGAVSQTGGTVRTSSTTIVDNTGIGLFNNAATVISFGNNSIRGNAGGDTSGTITNVGTQ
ncbi:MAG TPA: right-handed parallel beta-helix repeat-containing protein [Mycobacterium sp.]|nr:right-handed parallel beta-helix repeat-containing protein [Mycobacterium sp.]